MARASSIAASTSSAKKARRSKPWHILPLSKNVASAFVPRSASVLPGVLAFRCIVRAVTSMRSSSMTKGEDRSEEHTSELQSLMRISYAVFCLKKKQQKKLKTTKQQLK